MNGSKLDGGGSELTINHKFSLLYHSNTFQAEVILIKEAINKGSEYLL